MQKNRFLCIVLKVIAMRKSSVKTSGFQHKKYHHFLIFLQTFYRHNDDIASYLCQSYLLIVMILFRETLIGVLGHKVFPPVSCSIWFHFFLIEV